MTSNRRKNYHNKYLELFLSKKEFFLEDFEEFLEKFEPELIDDTNTAYFTPLPVLEALSDGINCGKHIYARTEILDIAGGVGLISFFLHKKYDIPQENFTIIEINEKFIEIGKKIMPKANWIKADIFSKDFMPPYIFDLVVSNPPFGTDIFHGEKNIELKYKGKDMVTKTIEIATKFVEDVGDIYFIVPSNFCNSKNVKILEKSTGIKIDNFFPHKYIYENYGKYQFNKKNICVDICTFYYEN